MSQTLSRRISIFLSLDAETVYDYFNPHDPAPIYKRQLGHQFQDYILSSVESAKRYSVIRYKVICMNEADRRFADPLIKSIKRHFTARKLVCEDEFRKFKRRNFKILGISLGIVIICQALFPLLFTDRNLSFGLHNGLDVFSWVILWKPIDKLVFHWNPYLKEIHLLTRLTNAETIIIDKTYRAQKYPELSPQENEQEEQIIFPS